MKVTASEAVRAIREMLAQAESERLRFLCAKLTPEQITACVEWAKKQVKHG